MTSNKLISATVAAIIGAYSIGSIAAAADAQAQQHAPAPQVSPQNAAPPSNTLETITVTAQRYAQNLQDVPISVTAFTPHQLTVQQITSTKDLAAYVPNMFAANNVGQSSANVYYIRGLGQTQAFPTFEPQVATYVDGIYLGRQNANNFALFGVQSVQVLNGPQGTLFGRNSTGGAIVVTLQQPRRNFGGDAQLGYGQIGGSLSNFVTAQASVNIPVSSKILTRTSFYGITGNGYVSDLTTHQRLNSKNNFGVREAVRLLPTSGVRWDLSADYERNNAANVLNQPGPNDTRISYSGFSVVGGALRPYMTGSKRNYGQGVLVSSYGLASHLQFDIGRGTLELITGYRGLHQGMAVDYAAPVLGNLPVADAVPTGEITLDQNLHSYQVSQEIKWHDMVGKRLTYTAGVFAYYDKNHNDYGQILGLSKTLAFALNDQYVTNDTTSLAAYAQGSYKVTRALTVTLGGRVTNEIKGVTAHPNQPGLGYDTAQIQAAGYPTHLRTTQFTPRLAVQYHFGSNLMAFASATKGFQGGGWNGLTGTNPVDFNNFRPETVWSYETGWRATPTDRLRLNATFFYEDVKNDQLLYDNPHTDSFDTSNGASMYGYGAEMSVEWRPTNRLTLRANISSMKAAYYDPAPIIHQQQAQCVAGVAASCAAGIVRQNGSLATPVFTPALEATVDGSYLIRFNDVAVTPFIAIHHLSSQWFDTANTLGPAVAYPGNGGMNPALNLVDASVTFADPTHVPFTVTAGCRNCTMVNYGVGNLLGLVYFNTPGLWDIRLNYAF